MWGVDDVMRLAGNDTGFISADNLSNIKSVKDLFSRFKKIILLYIHHKDDENIIGHYVALLDHGNSIEFFDSYGMKVDDILMMKSRRERMDTDQETNYLAKLLYNSGRTIEYNDLPLQSTDTRVSTCGVWSGIRCKYSQIPLNDWMNFWRKMKQTHKGKHALDKLAIKMASIITNSKK
jgi:hypothetical protein